MTDAFVGIDVSESGLALAVHQSDRRFECPLDPSALDKLINELKTLQPKLIVLSATRGGAAATCCSQSICRRWKRSDQKDISSDEGCGPMIQR